MKTIWCFSIYFYLLFVTYTCVQTIFKYGWQVDKMVRNCGWNGTFLFFWLLQNGFCNLIKLGFIRGNGDNFIVKWNYYVVHTVYYCIFMAWWKFLVRQHFFWIRNFLYNQHCKFLILIRYLNETSFYLFHQLFCIYGKDLKIANKMKI